MSFPNYSGSTYIRDGIDITFQERSLTSDEEDAALITAPATDPNDWVARRVVVTVKGHVDCNSGSVLASSVSAHLDPTDASAPPNMLVSGGYGGTVPSMSDGVWAPGGWSETDTQRGGLCVVQESWVFLGKWHLIDTTTGFTATTTTT